MHVGLRWRDRKVSGLDQIQIGDWIGVARTDGTHRQFAPPTLESVVVAGSSDGRARLRVALGQLAEQDPLINVRQDDTLNEISVSLYGEVQKEVIQATLANDFGIDVTFRETTTIYIERPVGTGAAVELLQDDENPSSATVGLRIEPAPIGTGVDFRLDVDPRSVPTYIYKTRDRFIDLMTQHTCRTLQEGLFGWQVTDCLVTMTECGYYVGDGPRKPTMPTPRTTAADFRKLTPVVLMRALERAKTVVCEPMTRASIETPSDTVAAVCSAVARLGGALAPPLVRGGLSTIDTVMPSSSGAGPEAAGTGAHGRRGGRRDELRRLPAGQRPATDAAANEDRWPSHATVTGDERVIALLFHQTRLM